MYPFWYGVVSLEASLRSGNCFSCCWSPSPPAQRLTLITTIMAEVLTVNELAGVVMFHMRGASPAPRQ